MTKAQEALDRLKAGNLRFVDDRRGTGFDTTSVQRKMLLGGQEPFAVVLGCSDSRVPVEILFDQGLGDLFVIRVAGNVVASSQIGSVEFAVEEFGTPLVVVLGHTGCGAVAATLAELGQPAADRSPNLASIVDRIIPAVTPLLDGDLGAEELALRATRANVKQSVRRLRDGSAILARHLEAGTLMIVGAEYDLRTGEVHFFTGDVPG